MILSIPRPLKLSDGTIAQAPLPRAELLYQVARSVFLAADLRARMAVKERRKVDVTEAITKDADSRSDEGWSSILSRVGSSET